MTPCSSEISISHPRSSTNSRRHVTDTVEQNSRQVSHYGAFYA
jgi:xanthine dioxygenase